MSDTEATYDSSPAAIAKAAKDAQELLNEGERVAVQVSAATPPSDTHVDLLRGYLDFDSGGYVTEAEVREMTGEDEERAARAILISQKLPIILERCTVKIGDKKVTKEILDQLTMGDWQVILLKIRIVTYGAEVKFPITCPRCTWTDIVAYDLNDLPTRSAENLGEFEVELSSGGKAVVTLPDGDAYRKALKAADDQKTLAEVNTGILAACLQSIEGDPVKNSADGVSKAKAMKARDRTVIIDAINEKQPIVEFDKASVKCGSCEEEILVSLGLGDLFQA